MTLKLEEWWTCNFTMSKDSCLRLRGSACNPNRKSCIGDAHDKRKGGFELMCLLYSEIVAPRSRLRFPGHRHRGCVQGSQAHDASLLSRSTNDYTTKLNILEICNLSSTNTVVGPFLRPLPPLIDQSVSAGIPPTRTFPSNSSIGRI
jgi:hypothetical protein